MKRILLLCGIILLSLPLSAQTLRNHGSGTTSNITMGFTPTVGDTVVVVTETSVVPASVQFSTGGTQAFPIQGSCPNSGAFFLCYYLIKSVATPGSHITCTTCGTMNAVYEWDWTGVDTTNTVDRRILCLNNLTTTNCEVDFHPAFSSEALMAAYVCSASSSTLGGNVTWVNVMTPNSNPGGDFISSGYGLVSVTPGTAGACGNNLGMILGLKASGATETCESDISWNQDEAEIGSSGSPSTSAFVNQVGDLIITTPWCITNGSTTCTVTSPLAGSDTMTDITVDGTNSSSTGQGHIYYVLSASAAGTQTITFTPSGTFLHAQIAYWDYTPSPGCTFSHHTDFSLGSGTGTAVNLPSFTPTTGDLLFAFAFVSNHTSSV